MDEKKENYYSTAQVADLIGCDKTYISMLCRNDSITCVKVAGRGRTGFKYMIPESAVEDLMLKREAEGGKVIMPKPITDSSKIDVISEDQKEYYEFVSKTTELFKAFNKRLDLMQEELSTLANATTANAQAQIDWMPRAKEFMEIYRQGYLEGYRNGFKDGSYKPAREKGDWK